MTINPLPIIEALASENYISHDFYCLCLRRDIFNVFFCLLILFGDILTEILVYSTLKLLQAVVSIVGAFRFFGHPLLFFALRQFVYSPSIESAVARTKYGCQSK